MNVFAKYFQETGLTIDNLYGHHDSGEPLECQFDIEPQEFLSFAEQRLENNETKSGFIDCLTHAKRAIDCQIDKILVCFGYNFKNYRILQKIDILGRLGIITPRILRKVRDKRNLLEHEYISPTKEEVEDALDIATLFVYATDRILKYFWNCYTLTENSSVPEEQKSGVYFEFKNEKKKLLVEFYIGKKTLQDVEFSSQDEIYPYLLSLSILLENERSIEGTIEKILQL